jgi:hypothetical protein
MDIQQGNAGLHFKYMQHGHAALTWTCRTNMQQGNAASAGSIYMLYRHTDNSRMQLLHATSTCSNDLQLEYAAGPCSVTWTCSTDTSSTDMQHGHAVGTRGMDMQRGHAAWTSGLDMRRGNAAKTYSKDMQHRHAPWTSSMDMYIYVYVLVHRQTCISF